MSSIGSVITAKCLTVTIKNVVITAILPESGLFARKNLPTVGYGKILKARIATESVL